MVYSKRVLVIFIVMSVLNSINAAGFQLFEGNARNVGDYGAGGGAMLKDSSAAYFNPAALTRLSGKNILVNNAVIITAAQFDGNITINNQITTPQSSNQYKSNRKISDLNYIPAVFYGAPVNEDLSFGVGFSVPFGLSTDWPADDRLGHAATKSAIKVLNLGPSFGYKVNKNLAIGAGIDLQYLDATLNSQSVSSDLSSKLSVNSAHSMGVGGHIGLLIALQDFDISLHYRTQVKHYATGDSKFGDKYKSKVSTAVMLPDTISGNVTYKINDQHKLLLGAYYTLWSSIQTIKLQNTASPLGPIEFKMDMKFHNTTRLAVGYEYAFKGNLLARIGGGYETSPTYSPHRSIRLPDDNRYAVAVGLQYVYNNLYTVDIGYTHLFIHKAKIDHKLATPSQETHVDGVVKSNAYLISLQITINL